MKTIIAGSRTIFDPFLIGMAVGLAKTEGISVDELVCGMYRGVDMTAYNIYKRYGIPIKECYANWDAHGLAAGPIRNRQMAEYADALIAVWDGKSTGTDNMIEEAKKRGLKVFVYKI